jgi:hypothetical protein
MPYNARLRIDALHPDEFNPNNRWNLHSAIETEISEFVLFRLGARLDEVQEQRFVTAGLAFNGPNLKIDYAIEKNLFHTGGAVHSVDLRTSF